MRQKVLLDIYRTEWILDTYYAMALSAASRSWANGNRYSLGKPGFDIQDQRFTLSGSPSFITGSCARSFSFTEEQVKEDRRRMLQKEKSLPRTLVPGTVSEIRPKQDALRYSCSSRLQWPLCEEISARGHHMLSRDVKSVSVCITKA